MISDLHKDKVWSCQVSRKLKTKPKRFNVVPNHTHSSSPQPLYGWLEGLASGLETITVSGNKSSRIHLHHHFLLSSVITRNPWNLILSWHLMISVGMWIFTEGFPSKGWWSGWRWWSWLWTNENRRRKCQKGGFSAFHPFHLLFSLKNKTMISAKCKITFHIWRGKAKTFILEMFEISLKI